jgi:hypothetical protein
VWAAAALDDLARAEAAARAIADPDQRAAMLFEMVRISAPRGDFARAAAVASAIERTDWRADAFAELAEGLAVRDLFDQAVATAESIDRPLARSSALQRVVLAAARRGRPEIAADVASRILDPRIRDSARRSIAAAPDTGPDARPRVRPITRAAGAERDVYDPADAAARLSTLAGADGTDRDIDRLGALAFQSSGTRLPLGPLARLRPDVVSHVAAETMRLIRRARTSGATD